TAANATTFVTTNHTIGAGSVSAYDVNVGVNFEAKLPVSMTLFSGPNVAVPYDIVSSNNGFFQPVFNSSATPTVGDNYQFLVTFEDGTTQVLSSAVNGLVTSVPQNLQVV